MLSCLNYAEGRVVILGSYLSIIESRKSQEISNYFEKNIVYNLTIENLFGSLQTNVDLIRVCFYHYSK